jgi:hypothetical protein
VHEEFFHELQDEMNLATSSFSFDAENAPENLHMELIDLQGNSMQFSKSFGLSSKSKYCNLKNFLRKTSVFASGM